MDSPWREEFYLISDNIDINHKKTPATQDII